MLLQIIPVWRITILRGAQPPSPKLKGNYNKGVLAPLTTPSLRHCRYSLHISVDWKNLPVIDTTL